MARVNLEDRFFGDRRVDRLARKMGWTKHKAIGVLVMLWHESQELLRTSGTEAEIAEWTFIDDPEEALQAVHVLIHCAFLVRDDQGLLEIIGNAAQISWCLKNAHRGKKGGEATKAKWLKIQEAEGATPSRTPSPGSTPTRPNTMQGNTMQGNARQCKPTTVKPKKPPADLDPSDLTVGREWLDYAVLHMPWKREDPSWTAQRFGEAIAALRAKTSLNHDGVRAVLKFVRDDSFWQKNALSPAGLLKKSDKNGLRKIDNILARLRGRPELEAEALKTWAASDDNRAFSPFE